MPSVSDKQKVAMAIACHDPEKSTSGIPKDVACDFNRADAAKHKRAKRKVKEAVEYLETLKMIEDVRNMSFTNFLVESSGKSQAPDALTLISQIENQATQAAQSNTPGGQTFFDRVRQALKDSNIQGRLMGALRAQAAYNATNEGLTQEEADALVMISEAVSIPADASFAEVEKMYKAALRGRALADKLKDPVAKKKHKSRITGNFNTLSARYKKMKAAHEKDGVKESLTEWTLSDVKLALKGKHGDKVREMQKLGKDNYTRADLKKVGLGDLMVDVAKEGALIDGAILEEKKKPSAGLSKKQKTATVKKARSGKNVFGGGFNKVEKAGAKEYGSKKAGERVAGSIMWKKKAKLAKARESVDFAAPEVDFIVESAFEYQKMMRKLNKVFEKYLDPADYDDKKAIIKVAMEHGAKKVDGFEVMTQDEKMDLIIETCMKYDLAEAFGDEDPGAPGGRAPDMGADDPEAFSRGVDTDDQQIGEPSTSVSRSNFKLEPADIGKVAEIIAKYSDYPPEDRNLASAVQKLQYADLFHLTPPEVVTARRLLAHAANDVGA
jgi:hypothetical protein